MDVVAKNLKRRSRRGAAQPEPPERLAAARCLRVTASGSAALEAGARIGESRLIAPISARAAAAASTAQAAPVTRNEPSLRTGPSIVAALVKSTPNVRPGAASLQASLAFGTANPGTAPAFLPGRFRRFRRSPRLGAGQRSTRFFALIELDVHRPEYRGYPPVSAKRRYVPPSTPGVTFSAFYE
jgi:hypothetical protein